jgi:transketolase C-terminal domain/subunit
MEWIMEGNRGLVYVRVMRTPSAVIYGSDYRFDFGVGHILRNGDSAMIVSSGRGVHEALTAAEFCPGAGVVDMPSIDEDLLLRLYDSGKLIVFAEQNNGYIWQSFLRVLYRRRPTACATVRVKTLNTLTPEGRAQFIHSATYEELIEAYGLSAPRLAAQVRQWLEEKRT